MEWKGMEWNGREGIEWNRRAGNETGMVDWPHVFSYLPFQCLPVQWQVPESDGPIIRHGHKPREVFIEAQRKDHPLEENDIIETSNELRCRGHTVDMVKSSSYNTVDVHSILLCGTDLAML